MILMHSCKCMMNTTYFRRLVFALACCWCCRCEFTTITTKGELVIAVGDWIADSASATAKWGAIDDWWVRGSPWHMLNSDTDTCINKGSWGWWCMW